MMIGGKDVIMRETLSVILNECEGSITVMRGNSKMLFRAIDSSLRVMLWFFLILIQHSYPVQNDEGR